MRTCADQGKRHVVMSFRRSPEKVASAAANRPATGVRSMPSLEADGVTQFGGGRVKLHVIGIVGVHQRSKRLG